MPKQVLKMVWKDVGEVMENVPKVAIGEILMGNGSIIPDHRVIYNEDTKDIIAVVSSKYTLIRHEVFIDAVVEALKGTDYDVYAFVGYGKNMEKLYIYTGKAEYIEIGDDRIRKGLVFSNSVDGSVSVRIKYNLFRLACRNGMVLKGATELIKHIHRGVSINEDKLYDWVEEGIKIAEEQYVAIEKTIRVAMEKEIDIQATLEYLTNRRYPKWLINALENRVRNAKLDGSRVKTAWDMYNEITNLLTHGHKDAEGKEYKVKSDIRREQLHMIAEDVLKGQIEVVV